MHNKPKHHAYIGLCPLCRQGSLVIARERDTGTYYVCCEDCETEWHSPEDAVDIRKASRNKFNLSDFLSHEEVAGHPWESFVK